MIKLIVGLGNPGQQYEKTRHNAGFLCLDHLVDSYSLDWSNESKFNALLAAGSFSGVKRIFLKPMQFMNRSGLAVAAVARYYKIDANEILVMHDDLDLSVGSLKLKMGGGHAGHNGLRDIVAHLAVKDFYRVRIGIGRPSPGKKVADFVLSSSSKEEQRIMTESFDLLTLQMDKIIGGEISSAMNVLNQGNKI